MNLRHLEYVVAVVDEGSFGRAATACHVSQPALSQGIASLERELGTRLFRRSGRRAVATDAGERVARSARRALRAAEGVRAAARTDGHLAGQLAIAAPPTVAASALVPYVAAFRARHPRVTVRIEAPDDVDRVNELVRLGACELGVTYRPVRAPLRALALGDEEFLAVLPPGSDVPSPLPWRAIDLPLVVPAGPEQVADQVATLRSRRSPIPGIETMSREAVVPLVLAGAGVAFLPSALAAGAVAQGAVAVPVDPPVRLSLSLVHHPDELSPAGNAFLALVESSRPTADGETASR